MGYEKKQKSPEEAMAEESAKKLKLERRFSVELFRLFNEIGRQARSQFVSTGQLLDAAEFTDELGILIRQQGRRTGNQFRKTLRNDINSERDNFRPETIRQVNSEELDARVTTLIAAFTAVRSRRISQEITRTNQETLQRSLGKATADAVRNTPEGRTPTRAAIGVGLQREFRALTPGRVTTIAMTETETFAEQSKGIEAQTLDGEISSLGISKMWITAGDSRVRNFEDSRFSHVLADRQLVPEDQPFSVSGELLMFPKDRSLGASLGNVVNCRCIANRFAQEVTE